MTNMSKNLLLSGCIFLCFISCKNTSSDTTTVQEPQKVVSIESQNITYEIIAGSNNTFGYDILVNGKKRIHQEHIPAVAGTDGFKTEAQARKVAEFLIEKMKKGESLPAISPTELNQLGVL